MEATSSGQVASRASGPPTLATCPTRSSLGRRHACAAVRQGVADGLGHGGRPTVRTTSGRSASGIAPFTEKRSPPCTVKGPCTPLPHSARHGRLMRRFWLPRWVSPGLGPATTRAFPLVKARWKDSGKVCTKRGEGVASVSSSSGSGGHRSQIVERLGKRHVQMHALQVRRLVLRAWPGAWRWRALAHSASSVHVAASNSSEWTACKL